MKKILFIALAISLLFSVESVFAQAPTSQATNVSGSGAAGSHAMTISWTRGTPNGGDAVIVIMADGNAVTDPSNSAEYVANNLFGQEDSRIPESSTYVVYDGTGTDVLVTGLSDGNNYYFKVCEYNNSSFEYLTTGASNQSNTALPIELLEFKVSIDANGNSELTWLTASETNNDYFTIENSLDITNWAEVAQIPGAGTTNELMTYSYTDISPFDGLSYYRLKQTDYDGQFSFSNPVAVNNEQSDFSKLQVFPNPFVNEISIDFNTNLKSKTKIEIRNQLGILLKEEEILANKFNHKLELDKNLSAGIYFITISNENETIVRKLVKE